MDTKLIFLSVPGLREGDLAQMPHLSATMANRAVLVPSFPCVTWPVQANMLTGCLPADHGVVANGFYWRDRQQVEMWTAGRPVHPAPTAVGPAASPDTSAFVGRLVSDAEQRVRGRRDLHARPGAQP